MKFSFLLLGLIAGLSSLASLDLAEAHTDRFSKRLPPPVLYHYGQRVHLLEDAALNTIPKDVWDRFVMGGEGRYQLKPYRRGLYGSEHPGIAAYYGDLMFGKGKTPWFMAIHIKPECRKPEKVAFVSELPRSEVFKKWYVQASDQAFESFSDFVGNCYVYEEDNNRYLPINMDEVNNDGRPETSCEKVVDSFFREEAIQIVYDSAWPHSWYLRDRSCIQEIVGNDLEMLEMMAFLPGFWNQDVLGGKFRSTYISPRQGAATFTIFAQVIKELPELPKRYVELTRRRLDNSDYFEWAKLLIPLILDKAEECVDPELRAKFEKVLEKFIVTVTAETDEYSVPIFDAAIDELSSALVEVCH